MSCSQALQLLWLASFWYVLGGHRCIVPVSSSYAPGTDTQLQMLAEPAEDCVRGGQLSQSNVETLYLCEPQSVHGSLPAMVLMLPPAHATHESDCSVYPGAHTHMSASLEALGEMLLGGHCKRSCVSPPGQ